MEELIKGIVLKSTGSWYKVKSDDGEYLDCQTRGKFRIQGIKSTNPIAVGDEVWYKEEGETGVIQKIEERRNILVRKSINLSKQTHILASNIDRIYLLVTLAAPQTRTAFIDRFLVSADSFRIPVTILFNKIDIYEEESLEMVREIKSIYENIGFECHEISATDEKSIEFLKKEITGKKVMFGGHSGVGKSTLLQSLDPDLDIRIGDLSITHMSGQHTTTFAEMHETEFGGYIIDTPGIRAFGLIDFEKEELCHYFREFRPYLNQCKFHNCVHVNEPQCAIKEAVEEGDIHEERYRNYLSMYNEDHDDIYRTKNPFM
jgi:ribosome biogenesis GTPase